MIELEIQPTGQFSHGVIFPANRLTGLRVDKLQGRIGVLGHNDDFPSFQIG